MSVPSVATTEVAPSDKTTEFDPLETVRLNPVTAFDTIHQFSVAGTVMVAFAEIPPFVNRWNRCRTSFVV
jgi:hypothetical protein